MAVLTSTGITFSDATSQATRASTAADVQTLLATGTWTKPTGGQTMARVQLWGGGGGAGRGTANDTNGGGGGGYNEVIVPLSQINTQTINIGAGGTGRTASTGNGTAGGNTTMTINSLTVGAFGGGPGGGTNAIGGGGGSTTGAGGLGGVSGTPQITFSAVNDTIQQGGALGGSASNSFYLGGIFQGGAGGNVSFNQTQRGFGSIYGGGGGAYGASSSNSSIFGGAGGVSGGAGVQPGGGGSTSGSANSNGGNGAAGKAVITSW